MLVNLQKLPSVGRWRTKSVITGNERGKKKEKKKKDSDRLKNTPRDHKFRRIQYLHNPRRDLTTARPAIITRNRRAVDKKRG